MIRTIEALSWKLSQWENSHRKRQLLEVFRSLAAGSLAANNVAIARGRDCSIDTMSIVVKYFCQRGHLCEADHLVVSHQVEAKKRSRRYCASRAAHWTVHFCGWEVTNPREPISQVSARRLLSRFSYDAVDLIVQRSFLIAPTCWGVSLYLYVALQDR